MGGKYDDYDILECDTAGSTSDDGEHGKIASKHTATFIDRARQYVTAEPVMLFYFLGVGLMYPAFAALTYHKVCTAQFNQSTCDNLKNETFKEQEDIVQTITSHWFLYQHWIYEIPSMFLTFCCGAIGDTFSRRVALALPCLGEVIGCVFFIFNAVYMDAPVAYLLSSRLASTVFGGGIGLRTGVFSLIGEVSSTENRTFRISMAQGIEALSITISYFMSGIILDHTSYIFIAALSLSFNLIAVLYCFTWLLIPQRQSHMTTKEAAKAVCDPQNVKGTLTCVFKKRPQRGRKRLLSIMVSIYFGMVSHACKYTHP